MITIEPATMEHARTIRLRDGDAMEIAALGVTKEAGLGFSLARSIWANAYLADGEVAAISGLALTSMIGGDATLWLITGEPVNRYKKEFLRLTRQRLAEVRREWPVLIDYVHAPYTEALRWLGFAIEPPRPFGPLGAPFCRAVIGEQA